MFVLSSITTTSTTSCYSLAKSQSKWYQKLCHSITSSKFTIVLQSLATYSAKHTLNFILIYQHLQVITYYTCDTCGSTTPLAYEVTEHVPFLSSQALSTKCSRRAGHQRLVLLVGHIPGCNLTSLRRELISSLNTSCEEMVEQIV